MLTLSGAAGVNYAGEDLVERAFVYGYHGPLHMDYWTKCSTKYMRSLLAWGGGGGESF